MKLILLKVASIHVIYRLTESTKDRTITYLSYLVVFNVV